MNERILELISETDEWLENNAQSDRWEREIKFAELIVQECAKVIYDTELEYNEIDAMHRIRDNVKQHFGVEK